MSIDKQAVNRCGQDADFKSEREDRELDQCVRGHLGPGTNNRPDELMMNTHAS